MNKQIQIKWLQELRSKKYPQTFKKLHDDTGYCVLGVLCQIYADEKRLPIEQVIGRDDKLPPKKVVDWAGLSSNNPIVLLEDGSWDSLSYLNDRGADFYTLADLIEKNFW